MPMSDTTSDSVLSHAQRITELVTAICNSMLETSLILPKLVQAIGSLDTLLRTISQFEIVDRDYDLGLDMQQETGTRASVGLHIQISRTCPGIRMAISTRSRGGMAVSGTDWQEFRTQISAGNMDRDTGVLILLTAQTIACNIDKIIQWLESILEDVNRRNSTLLGYVDLMHRVLSDPQISKLLVLGATTPRE